MKKFSISYLLQVEMTEEDIYPDGVEGEVTPKRVAALIEASGGMKEVIKDWNLYPHGYLTVYEKI